MNTPTRAAWTAARHDARVTMANNVAVLAEAMGVIAGNRALGVWGQTAVALVLAVFVPFVLALQLLYALAIGAATLLRHPGESSPDEATGGPPTRDDDHQDVTR
ncbi:hypothetical protein [Saccharothrix sp. HUAS TT1]|uniref:hypothetical protein n=1 Tax=unclassified Saccharothrix TaxID=2593673 RepID=UPI00345B8BD5